MVTCYDAWSAKILNESPVDCILVGDSLAVVMHGFESTVHATVEMMTLHTAAVARGAPDQEPYKHCPCGMDSLPAGCLSVRYMWTRAAGACLF